MKKTVIIYASTHHGNTRKLIEAISEKYQIDIIDAIEQKFANLSEYDLIGFASGIDFGKFYDVVEQFLKRNLPDNKEVFFLYTCARDDKDFTYTMRTEAMKRHALLMGEYGCRGYNTYGAWKVIGGMNKHHPTKKELDGAVKFYESLIE